MSTFDYTAKYAGVYSLGTEILSTLEDDTAETLAGDDLVSNGGFGSDTIWNKGANWAIAAGIASHTAGSTADIDQSITYQVGTSVRVTYDVLGMTTGSITMGLKGGTTVSGTARLSNNTYVETLVVATGNNLISFTPTSAFDGDIDNVTIFVAVPDSSVNVDSVEVHGDIIKTAVGVGSGTVGYGDYSATNFLEQPYSSVHDVGATGNYSICGWVKLSSLPAVQYVCRKGDVANSTGVGIAVVGSGDFYFFTRAASVSSQIFSTDAILLSEWTFISATRGTSGTVLKMYKNGNLRNTDTLTARDIDSTEPMNIGYASHSSSQFLNGDLSLLKFYDSELSATQIKTIYNAEKHLFKRYWPYRVVGNLYQLSAKSTVKQPTLGSKGPINISVGGSIESIKHSDEDFINVNSTEIINTDVPKWSDFIKSTDNHETFIYTPGASYEPNEPTTVSRENRSVPYQRRGVTTYHDVNFKLRAR